MTQRRRITRYLLIGLVALVVLALIGWYGVRTFLSTAYARNAVADKLAELIGAPVEVTQMNVGWGSSAAAFAIHEPPSDSEPSRPLMDVQHAKIQAPLSELVNGEMPQHITLSGVKFYLRFDRDGHLLTRLPSAGSSKRYPTFTIHDASVEITQVGRPTFYLQGLDGEVTLPDGQATITATIRDPNWGEWSAQGQFQRPDYTGTFDIQSKNVPLVEAQLKTLPVVPESFWKQVTLSGSTAIAAHVSREKVDRPLDYRITVTPHKASVAVASINFKISDVNGRAEIANDVVRLEKISAKAAEGDIQLDGRLNFSAAPPLLQFDVDVQHLNLQKLPSSWALPQQLEGYLKGHAKLELAIHDGRVETRGVGKGEVEQAKIAGIPAEKVEMRLVPSKGGFHFTTPQQQSRALDRPPFHAAILLTALVYQAPPPQPAAPTTFEISFNFKDVDVAKVVERFMLKIPVNLAGKISLQAKAKLPISEIRNLRAYDISGRFTSARLSVNGFPIDDFRADLGLHNGVLTLDQLLARIPPEGGAASGGIVSGTARMELEPQRDLTANLTIQAIPIEPVLQLLELRGDLAAGRIGANVQVRAPVAQLDDRKAWHADATLNTTGLVVLHRAVQTLQVTVHVENNVATLKQARLVAAGIDAQADGRLTLAAPFRYAAEIRAQSSNVADLKQLAPDVDLPVDAQGQLGISANLKGTLSPRVIEASGTASASALQIAAVRLDRSSLRWVLTPNELQISDVQAKAFDGAITGKATVPLKSQNAGAVNLNFGGVDAAAISRAWPSLPVTLTGRLAGQATLKISPTPRQVTAEVDFGSQRLRIDGVPTDQLQGHVRYRPSELHYALTGAPLGGTLEVDGQIPFTAQAPPSGRLKLHGAELARWPGMARALRGRIDADFEYHTVGETLGGQGRIDVVNLGWRSVSISDRITAKLNVAGPILRIDIPTGALAGGEISGRGRYDLSGRERGYLAIYAYRVDAKRLLAPIPDFAEHVDVTFDGQIRASLGRELRGTARVQFARGSIFGLRLNNGSIPIDWAYAPGYRGELSSYTLSAQGGTGRITGQVKYAWGMENRLRGNLRFTGIDLRSVLSDAGSFASVGVGRANGHFDFQADRFQGIDDISGTLGVNFANTSVLDVPVLRPIAAYISPGQALTAFNSGDLLAHLAHSVFRIERLTLEAPSAKVFGSGTVTIASRLDLDLVAMTGQIGVNPNALALVGLQIPALGPIPVSTLMRVTNALSNRVIRLHVGGTIGNPTVQVNTTQLLTEGAVRYFLGVSGLPRP